MSDCCLYRSQGYACGRSLLCVRSLPVQLVVIPQHIGCTHFDGLPYPLRLPLTPHTRPERLLEADIASYNGDSQHRGLLWERERGLRGLSRGKVGGAWELDVCSLLRKSGRICWCLRQQQSAGKWHHLALESCIYIFKRQENVTEHIVMQVGLVTGSYLTQYPAHIDLLL